MKSPLLLSLSLIGCQDITLEFDRASIGDLLNVDGTPDAAQLDGSLFPEFEPGGECADFPNPCDETLDKCTLVRVNPEQAELRSACVREQGSRGIQQTCERAEPGNDDCAAGGFCTPLGVGTLESGPYECVRLCVENEVCDADQRCFRVTEDPDRGVCVFECEIFGDRCPAGLRCAADADTSSAYFGHCVVFGAAQEGEACETHGDCGEQTICAQPDGVCRAQCDDEHACPEQRRCVRLGLGDPRSPSICVP